MSKKTYISIGVNISEYFGSTWSAIFGDKEVHSSQMWSIRPMRSAPGLDVAAIVTVISLL